MAPAWAAACRVDTRVVPVPLGPAGRPLNVGALDRVIYGEFVVVAEPVGALGRHISADNQSAEPGQLSFEWFIDGNDAHIYECYQDSAGSGMPLTQREGGMPESQGPEQDGNNVLNPAVK